MDRLQAMEVFVRVAELGSFSKTAEQMGLPAATVTNAIDRFVDLVGEGVDCVVRVGILSDSSLIDRNIGAMEQITYAAKTYLDRRGRPRTLAELEQHVMINYFSSRTGRDLPWEYMQNGELKTLKLQGQVSVASSEAYMACCLAGLGIVQAPRFGVEDLLEQGVLEEVLPAFKPPPMPVSIVYSHNRHLSPRVRAFVDWLAEMLKIR